MLRLERGAGGGAPEADGGREQQVQAAHHHRRALQKGAAGLVRNTGLIDVHMGSINSIRKIFNLGPN